MRPSVESGPVNLARVLALEEKGLGLAILEAEDLAVTTDVQLALWHQTLRWTVSGSPIQNISEEAMMPFHSFHFP